MASNRQKTSVALLLEILDQGYTKSAWHGPNLRQSLRGVSTLEAAWRPGPSRHNIWETVVHAAYWKYAVRRRLVGGPRGGFVLKGHNWIPRPNSNTDAAWKRDRELLAAEHRKLRAAVVQIGSRALQPKFSRQIFGVAFHDVYHAGQIQLLKRLQQKARRG